MSGRVTRVLRIANQVLSFLVEIALLGAAYAGSLGMRAVPRPRWIAGLLLVAAIIVFWSFWMAPTSRRRIAWPLRPAVALVLFWAGAWWLRLGGFPGWGLWFAIGATLNVAGLWAFRQ